MIISRVNYELQRQHQFVLEKFTCLNQAVYFVFIHQFVRIWFFETFRAESMTTVLHFLIIKKISILLPKAVENLSSIEIEQLVCSGWVKSSNACWVLVRANTIIKWLGYSDNLIPWPLSIWSNSEIVLKYGRFLSGFFGLSATGSPFCNNKSAPEWIYESGNDWVFCQTKTLHLC